MDDPPDPRPPIDPGLGALLKHVFAEAAPPADGPYVHTISPPLDDPEPEPLDLPAFMSWLVELAWQCEAETESYGRPAPCGWTNGNDWLYCKGCGADHPQAEAMRQLATAAGLTLDVDRDRIKPPA